MAASSKRRGGRGGEPASGPTSPRRGVPCGPVWVCVGNHRPLAETPTPVVPPSSQPPPSRPDPPPQPAPPPSPTILSSNSSTRRQALPSKPPPTAAMQGGWVPLSPRREPVQTVPTRHQLRSRWWARAICRRGSWRPQLLCGLEGMSRIGVVRAVATRLGSSAGREARRAPSTEINLVSFFSFFPSALQNSATS